MSLSISWIEPETLANALGRVGVPPASSSGSLPSYFAPPAGNPPPAPEQSFIAPSPPVARSRTASEPARTFRPPEGGLQTRLKAFIAWVLEQTRSEVIFVLDEEGLVLMEKNADANLIAVSSSFVSYHDRIRSCLGTRSQGSITIDLEDGELLHLMEASTELGRFALGIIVDEPISRPMSRSFQEGLTVVLQEQAVETGGH